MGRTTVWRSILAEAWTRTVADLRLQGGGYLMVSAVLFALYAVFVWYIVGEQHALAEVRDRLLLIGAPLAVFPAWWVVRLLLTIPDREIAAGKRITKLRYYLTPRVDFELLSDGDPVEFNKGSIVTLVGGDSVTNVTAYDRAICGVVSNPTRKDTDIVDVKIIEIVGDNGARLRDPVVCHWLEINYGGEWTSIPAESRRTVRLFRVAEKGVYFDLEKLPIEYVHFFDGGRRFTGKLVVTDRYHGGLIIHFILTVGDHTKMEIVHTDGAEAQLTRDFEDELPEIING